KTIALLFVFTLVFSVFGIGATASAQDDPIRVGSKQFTEQIVLGQIILVALEDAGFAVEDRTNLGSTQVNRDALVNGEIDVYPEYTGTALFNYFSDVDWANIPDEAYGDRTLGYALVSSYDAAANDLVWLEPTPANNTYAFAVTAAFAEENNLYSALDLADYVNSGGEVFMATGDEFAQRPDGIPSFEETYGFDLTEDQLLIIAGGTPAQTEQALNEGANGVNMAMAYATDGALQAYNFVVLEDPFGAQPIYAPTPVFRGEIIRANPEIAGVLNPIFRTLDNVTLQSLNAAVEVDGENPTDVATTWLSENGFIGG
ncbi:MAG: glycine betaine ABC transporter substrate-binding protein, partial [Chloroflexota bacterium]